MRWHLAAFFAFIPAAAHAAGPDFTIKQLMVGGSRIVDAQALNDTGVIAGSYGAASGAAAGFVLDDGKLTKLPAPAPGCSPACPAHPTAINARGDVAGSFYTNAAYGFLWRNGAYDPAAVVALAVPPYVQPILALNNHDEEIFNYYAGNDFYAAIVGIPPNFGVLGIEGADVGLTGLNAAGVLTGTRSIAIGGKPIQAVFVDRKNAVRNLVPRGAAFVQGGAISLDNIAGSYTEGRANGTASCPATARSCHSTCRWCLPR